MKLLALIVLAGRLGASALAGTTALYVDDLCSPENSGADGSGNGYTLVSNGTVSFPASSPDPAEGSYSMGPSTDANYVSSTAGLNTAWSSLNAWTWQAYVYPNSLANSPVVCSWADGSGGFENFILIQPDGNVEVCYKAVINGAAATGSIQTDEWTHLAVTHNGTAWNVYIAGVKVTAVANTLDTGTVTKINMGRFLSANFGFNGYLDQIRFTAGEALTEFPTEDPAPNPYDKRGLKLRNYLKFKLGFIPFLLMASGLDAAPMNQIAMSEAVIRDALAVKEQRQESCATNCDEYALRVGSFGHSISWGQTCAGPGGDGFRAAMVGQLCIIGTPVPGFIGTLSVPAAGSAITCNKTDAESGLRIAQIFNVINKLPTFMPTPTAQDWVILGPALTNDVTDGKDLAYMEGQMKACIEKIAGMGGPVTWVVNDIPRDDGEDLTAALAAAYNAYTWALGEGYNVKFIDANSCVSVADLCADNIHLLPGGYTLLGQCMANQMRAQL